ncbi:MAG TPA: ABC transporter ATP-binding protein [Pirellulales bacterium]|nr:ABC transporter ATP-binding protein [Pirellulales bacterium]
MARAVLVGLSKTFGGGAVACQDLDLEVADGELLVLVGPSGSGKTTILRLVAGLEQPTSGSVYIGGRLVNAVAPRCRNVSMVFQNPALYPHLNVFRNLAFGLELREGGRWYQRIFRRLTQVLRPQHLSAHDADIRARVMAAAKMLGIERLLDRPATDLSGGEQQRVALCRAILRQPALFLFDEPLSNLDAQLRFELRRQLKQLHQRLGATMIYVTHDQAEALALGDRIAVLNRGSIEQVARPREIYDRPANRFVAAFIGNAPMNLFQAEKVGEDGPWRLTAQGWSIAVASSWWRGGTEGRSAVVGMRPEDVHVCGPQDGFTDGNYPTTPATAALVEFEGDGCLVSFAPGKFAESAKQASPERPGAVLLGKALVSSGLKPGEQIIAWFDMRRAHWFDGESGRNLQPPSAD